MMEVCPLGGVQSYTALPDQGESAWLCEIAYSEQALKFRVFPGVSWGRCCAGIRACSCVCLCVCVPILPFLPHSFERFKLPVCIVTLPVSASASPLY